MKVRIPLSSCKNYWRWLLEVIPHFHGGGRWGGFQLHIPGERSMEGTLPMSPNPLTHSSTWKKRVNLQVNLGEGMEPALLTWPGGTYISPFCKVQKGISKGEHSPGEQSLVTGRYPGGTRIRHTFSRWTEPRTGSRGPPPSPVCSAPDGFILFSL